MEQKTKIQFEEGKSDLTITREFDLPVDLLFKAHVDAEIFEEWMTHEYARVKVLKMEAKQHGGWQFETIDNAGNKVFAASGVIHAIVPNEKIIRTFEMENTPFPVQLEFLDFESLGNDRSKLNMQIVYRSIHFRDEMLKLPFKEGLNMAHNRLQQVLSKVK